MVVALLFRNNFSICIEVIDESRIFRRAQRVCNLRGSRTSTNCMGLAMALLPFRPAYPLLMVKGDESNFTLCRMLMQESVCEHECRFAFFWRQVDRLLTPLDSPISDR